MGERNAKGSRTDSHRILGIDECFWLALSGRDWSCDRILRALPSATMEKAFGVASIAHLRSSAVACNHSSTPPDDRSRPNSQGGIVAGGAQNSQWGLEAHHD